MRRRNLLGGLAAAPLIGRSGRYCAMAAQAAAPMLASLRDVAASRGLVFGTAIEDDMPSQPLVYQDLVTQHCAIVAANLSWSHIAPGPGMLDFVKVAPSLRFASDHDLKLTGSHLLWYETWPAWFGERSGRYAVERLIADHITGLVGQFRGQVFSWNVLNEAILPHDGRADQLRVHGWLDRFDVSLLDLAFQIARAADPQALLVYNDFDFYADIPEHEVRRQALLRLIDTWKRRQTPLDAIGLQSHLQLADDRPFNSSLYRRFLAEIAARGLKIIISELDVLNPPRRHIASDASDLAVAELYGRFLATALDEPAVVAVVTWGLSDRYSWLRDRVDRRQRPLPFDAQFQPKPAYYAVLHALGQAPIRHPVSVASRPE